MNALPTPAAKRMLFLLLGLRDNERLPAELLPSGALDTSGQMLSRLAAELAAAEAAAGDTHATQVVRRLAEQLRLCPPYLHMTCPAALLVGLAAGGFNPLRSLPYDEAVVRGVCGALVKEVTPDVPSGSGSGFPQQQAITDSLYDLFMLVSACKSKACMACHVKTDSPKHCSRCQLARYCDADCQRAEWNNPITSHRRLCAAAAQGATKAERQRLASVWLLRQCA